MADKTTHFGFNKPTEEEYADVGAMNDNMDTLDAELYKRGTRVNGVPADSEGNYQIDEVEFARQIVTDDLHPSSGDYIMRTTGGSAPISDGPAKLDTIFGRRIHTGQQAEVLQMTVTPASREPDPQTGEVPADITATIDRNTFVAYVLASATITLTYTDAWSANPSLYGVTVVGTPVAGDQIVIVYVKENRGVITVSNPGSFVSTGWNLYNHTAGYARVQKYSDTYGFLVGGTYTKIEFSETLTGEKIAISPVSGYFIVPSDGYVWVTGGNATDTYILMTWSDWGSGYEGSFQAYTESVITLTSAMTNFPNGLMQVGGVADEIDLDLEEAYSRIERMAYTAENLLIAEESGREYECDTDYIYIVREEPIVYEISISGAFTASDHGMEIVTGTDVPVHVQTLYGYNLVDKLRTDVVTKSQDLANNLTTNDSTKALTAAQGYVLNGKINDIILFGTSTGSFTTLSDLGTLLDTALNGMSNYEIKRIRVSCQADVSPFLAWHDYFVELYKSSGLAYSHATFNSPGLVPVGVAGRDTNGWSFDEVALNSKIATNGLKKLTQASFNGSYTVTENGFYEVRLRTNPLTASDALQLSVFVNETLAATQSFPSGSPAILDVFADFSIGTVITARCTGNFNTDLLYTDWVVIKLA